MNLSKKRILMFYLLKYLWIIVATGFYILWLKTQFGLDIDAIMADRTAKLYAIGIGLLLIGSSAWVFYIINRAMYRE
ncbi:MAG: hypothetical protein ABRQ24_07595 [Syntrophomonadaceae bacterium]